jgi:hypothetical protein
MDTLATKQKGLDEDLAMMHARLQPAAAASSGNSDKKSFAAVISAALHPAEAAAVSPSDANNLKGSSSSKDKGGTSSSREKKAAAAGCASTLLHEYTETGETRTKQEAASTGTDSSAHLHCNIKELSELVYTLKNDMQNLGCHYRSNYSGAESDIKQLFKRVRELEEQLGKKVKQLEGQFFKRVEQLADKDSKREHATDVLRKAFAVSMAAFEGNSGDCLIVEGMMAGDVAREREAAQHSAPAVFAAMEAEENQAKLDNALALQGATLVMLEVQSVQTRLGDTEGQLANLACTTAMLKEQHESTKRRLDRVESRLEQCLYVTPHSRAAAAATPGGEVRVAATATATTEAAAVDRHEEFMRTVCASPPSPRTV